MNHKLLYVFSLSLVSLIWNSFYAQNPSIIISGQVIEANTKLPIEYATISVIDKSTNNPITGTVSDNKGYFTVKTESFNFYVEITYLGYTTKTFKDITISKNNVDFNEVYLSEDLEALNEVIIRAEKSQTEFKLDKRIFNVGSDLTSTGASALEVLNNVPSVNVSIEGQVSLRGSQGVQILINGKPSVLALADGNALGTITADMIDRIEVITNPSAKYDASGTAGIINIIIKKSEERGLNGSASINFGVPNNNSFGLSINKRTEKFNLFSQIGAGIRTFKDIRKSLNQDILNDTTIISNERSNFDEKFSSILLGTDYYINDTNVITLSGFYAYEVEDQTSSANFERLFNETNLTDSWVRKQNTEATNPKIRYELQYKRDFKRHEDQDLLFSALGSSFAKDQSSLFENTTIIGDEPNSLQETRTDYSLEDYTFKLDYIHPFLEKYTLETGSQYVISNVSNDYEVNDFIDNIWVTNPDLTNVFDFDQKVLAFYNTLAYEGDIWGLKIGVRAENTNINTLLKTTNVSNKNNYTNLFPSIHSSYKISDDFSVQAGYSKRINRPGLRQLNPFNNIRNNFNISRGNPNLQPEYTDSYEITSVHKIENASLNFSLYNRYTTDVIENIVTFEDNISVSQPENIGTSNTLGFEVNGKYNPVNWFTISGDFNINYFNRKGVFETQNFDFKGDRWNTSITSKFKLPLEFDFEMSGIYNSNYVNIQGEVSESYFIDFGIRKKVLKGKFILNLSVRDAFATRIDENFSSQGDFYSLDSRQRGRFVTFGISYGFGKGEAMEFSGQR